MIVIGVDPGLRHTGLCLLEEGAEPFFRELKPKATNLLDCTHELENGLRGLVPYVKGHSEVWIGMERQLAVGGESSALMYLIQYVLVKGLRGIVLDAKWVLPLPVQLHSYLKKRHNLPDTKGRTIVKQCQTLINNTARLSSHCADAFYLALLARDVRKGTWQYNLPSKDLPIFPHRIENGQQD